MNRSALLVLLPLLLAGCDVHANKHDDKDSVSIHSDEGGNMYKTGTNSGEPVIAAPMTLGSGGIRSGALEQSNVDLSKEFINMIVASTGFSAASRVITTSNQLITELLNSSR